MQWLTALALITIVSGITISVVVLLAVRALRRTLNEGALQQAHQIKRLVESVAQLHRQQESARTKIQVLVEANRRLADELALLYERVGEGDGISRSPGVPRLLN
ncbi:MAG: hypothetical protein WCF85_11370 [Rhodospirillaceae bacterium]